MVTALSCICLETTDTKRVGSPRGSPWPFLRLPTNFLTYQYDAFHSTRMNTTTLMAQKKNILKAIPRASDDFKRVPDLSRAPPDLFWCPHKGSLGLLWDPSGVPGEPGEPIGIDMCKFILRIDCPLHQVLHVTV